MYLLFDLAPAPASPHTGALYHVLRHRPEDLTGGGKKSWRGGSQTPGNPKAETAERGQHAALPGRTGASDTVYLGLLHWLAGASPPARVSCRQSRRRCGFRSEGSFSKHFV